MTSMLPANDVLYVSAGIFLLLIVVAWRARPAKSAAGDKRASAAARDKRSSAPAR